ncbi:unnamed protein product (macronuclear) [Paramecium tetraurelia]|uniref:HTH LytTR-type domain-containing protein n=1 Tax=Paramecium tetraurelia TaxID=5888 RepID=A0C659_PARTE|nr:uncharacterized protein GSPATT00035405001 [Paramecium tetraurelia]CAK66276.1 unnamed protein product [Paramecium tetraurelia]|eukprot:XP_001433673.1 hypothetical protein (macronuclear) [Paramecium tetraurelia strain d4-2]
MNFNQIIRSRSKSPVRQIPRTSHISYFKVKEQRQSLYKKEFFVQLEATFNKIRKQLHQFAFTQIHRKLEIEIKKMRLIQTQHNQKILIKTLSKWIRLYKYQKMSQSLISSPTFSSGFKSPKNNSVNEFKAIPKTKKQSTLRTKKLCNALMKIQWNNKRLIFTINKIFQIQKRKKKSILFKWYKLTYKRLLLNVKLCKMVRILNKQIAKYLKAL